MPHPNDAAKRARTDHPVHELIARRWSPYAFDPRPMEPADARSLFEAARWAPSAYNEQPWRYLVALRQEEEPFGRLLSCLIEFNQGWARNASLLAIGLHHTRFEAREGANRTGAHDLGLASATLVLEATSRGLYAHQMSGILPERVRELYAVPAEFVPLTAIAIGYPAPPLPEEAPPPGEREATLRQRDATPRQRRPLPEFVFGERFGDPAAALAG